MEENLVWPTYTLKSALDRSKNLQLSVNSFWFLPFQPQMVILKDNVLDKFRISRI